MIRTYLVVITLAVTSTAGCLSSTNRTALLTGGPEVRSGIIRTSPLEPQPRPEDCYLDLVFDRNPTRPYVVIGRVSSTWVGLDQQALDATEEHALSALRSEACRAGGHVIFQFESRLSDQVDSALTRLIRSHALVAVYVRRDGTIAAAPTAARRVIRVPAVLPSDEQEASDEGLHPAWQRGLTDPWAVPAD